MDQAPAEQWIVEIVDPPHTLLLDQDVSALEGRAPRLGEVGRLAALLTLEQAEQDAAIEHESADALGQVAEELAVDGPGIEWTLQVDGELDDGEVLGALGRGGDGRLEVKGSDFDIALQVDHRVLQVIS
ncbi:hypothetical protein [Nannocystis pusilla]|uniref:hypothetical protein n=1 Tax=Nannocystis pusilla TaxID=889268 RepID=UPI003DA37B46